MQHRFLFRNLRSIALARLRLSLAPPLHWIGMVEMPNRCVEALAILGWQAIEYRMVGSDAFKKRGSVADFVGERVFFIVKGRLHAVLCLV